jgi:ParB-like nuclease family protein
MIADSVQRNGFYGALVVQRSTNYVLAGNHRLQAAQKSGIEQLPVIWVDVDDARAKRILLADNRSNDVATYDESELIRLLQELDGTDDGLYGTLYDAADLDDLLVRTEADTPVDASPPQGKPSEPEEGFNRYEHRDEWEASGRRLMILDYPVPLFVWVQEQLTAVGTARGLQANTDIIVALLQEATGAEPPAIATEDDADPVAAGA